MKYMFTSRSRSKSSGSPVPTKDAAESTELENDLASGEKRFKVFS